MLGSIRQSSQTLYHTCTFKIGIICMLDNVIDVMSLLKDGIRAKGINLTAVSHPRDGTGLLNVRSVKIEFHDT